MMRACFDNWRQIRSSFFFFSHWRGSVFGEYVLNTLAISCFGAQDMSVKLVNRENTLTKVGKNVLSESVKCVFRADTLLN